MAVFRGWRCLPGARLGQFMHSEASASPSEDAVASPASLYPPVVASLTAKSKIAKLRRREEYYRSIHNAPSVEEKLAIYGKRQRRKYVVYPQTWALNADRWYQHFTKTVFVPGLPASVSVSEEDKKDSLDLAELRSLVCEVLLQEHYYQRKKRPKLFRASDQGPAPFITHLVPKLAAHLAYLNPELGSSSIIGSQVSDPCCYGHTQFHLLPDRVKRERLIGLNLTDQIDVPYRANAVASLFAWTGAQAMYQGFWSEDDVTRPFVSQAVIFEGRYFAFFCYQLNTLALTVEADQNNTRRNICWGTESKPLYESIENNDVKGFNDEVLAHFVKFLLNRSKEL
ncbi:hypothetical protein Chor_007972 [Crotalus horridus]